MTPAQRAAAERLAPVLNEIANSRAPSAAGFAVAEAAALLRELLAEPLRCPTDGGLCGAGVYCRPEPPNCDDFDRLAAEVEADPVMRPHLEAGRQWVQQALAEPQGESVAWCLNGKYLSFGHNSDEAAMRNHGWRPLVYAHPPQRQEPQGEPVTDECAWGLAEPLIRRLYDESTKLLNLYVFSVELTRAVERKHRILVAR